MDDRKFGVELEVIGIMPDQALDVFDSIRFAYSLNTRYRHQEYDMWKATTDSSINASSSCEIVSPILQGQEGLDQLKGLTNALNKAGASVNKSCGFHVHLDASDLSAKNLRTIIRRYAKHENEIDNFMPKSRRCNNNNYCNTMNDLHYVSNNPVYWFSDLQDNLATALSSKYMKVNLQCYIRQRTIEFRQHSGTLDYDKIANWVKFVMQFTKNCKENYENEYIDSQAIFKKYVRALTKHRYTYNVPTENLVNKLCDNVNEYVSYQDLIRAMHTNIWYELLNIDIKKYIKELRKNFRNLNSPLEIKNKRNFGYMLSMPQLLHYKNDNAFVMNDTIWDGIDDDVKTFYLNRAAQLSQPHHSKQPSRFITFNGITSTNVISLNACSSTYTSDNIYI